MQAARPDHTRIGHYEILREVARGFFSTVYEARFVDRRVSLKVLNYKQGGARFMHAAMTQAALCHPRIPPIYDVGEDMGRMYSARMFVEGDDLQNGIGSNKKGIAQVVTIVAQAAEALDYAHGRGITHGSVHPRHLLLGNDGNVWLIGFGETLPSQEMPRGNPAHFAPEQLKADGPLTPAADVYALCETALWLLLGRHPFAGFPGADLLAAKRTEQIHRRIPELLPDASPAVQNVFRRGLAAEPEARYPKPSDFASALADAASVGKEWWWPW